MLSVVLSKEQYDHDVSNLDLELATCQLLDITNLYGTDAADTFAIDAEEISFSFAPQIMEEEQKLQLNSNNLQATTIKTVSSKPDSQWVYKVVEGLCLTHHNDKIYVSKSPCSHVLQNWYHHYLCHPGGDKLSKTLQQVCTWKGITSQT